MMRPIYEFQTIQVELTNACVHECSNCTRFCGHHEKPFFMNWDTFKTAIDSLENWPRLIGIMGGEPTLHPEFRRFVEYAAKVHPMSYDVGGGHTPMKSLSKYMFDANIIKGEVGNRWRGLGLWSSVCNSYAANYETIQDNFIFQCINDHTASSRHHAWLLTRKEFDICDDDWIKMRDNCWWQRMLGSPSITPKGAFFCEVAAAMDMLFHGEGGWKVEKDWWKRDPDDYKEQLKWCELCSGAFISYDRDANESRDDVSPKMLEMLKSINGPKVKNNKIVLHKVGKESDIEVKPREYMLMYQTDPILRFTDKNKALYPKKIKAFLLEDDTAHFAKESEETARIMFEKVVSCAKKEECLGKQILNEISNNDDWVILFFDSSINIDPALREKINKTIFNPGTFHISYDLGMALFNIKAQSFTKAGYVNLRDCKDIDSIIESWPKEKVCFIDKKFDEIINGDIEGWKENITRLGLLRWDGNLRSQLSSLVVRRSVVPKIEAVSNSEADIEEKLLLLQAMNFEGTAPELVCDKIKTFVHNELARNLKKKNITEMKSKVKRERGYIFAYASAMLSSQEEIEDNLLRCIGDSDNIYGLGVGGLMSYYRYNNDGVSLLEEIQKLGEIGVNVIIGNRYVGKSIAMMMHLLGENIKCFVDDERKGYDFEKIPTLRADEAIKSEEKNVYVLAVRDMVERQIMMAVNAVDDNLKIVHLSPWVFHELEMSPKLEDFGIRINDLKNLTGENVRKVLKELC